MTKIQPHHILPIEPLSKIAFAPFGTVIETKDIEPRIINEGTTKRFHDLAPIDVGAQSGQPLVSLFRAQPRPIPIAIKMLERHPLGSQAFYPLAGQNWLIVVAKNSSENTPDLESLRCFKAAGHQGAQYHRNIWHHPLLVLKQEQDFLVIDRGDKGEIEANNLDEFWFAQEEDYRFIVIE